MAKAKKQAAAKTRTRKAKPRSGKTGGISGSIIMLTTLAIGAAGVLGYLGWQYMKSRKAKKSPNLDETLLRSNGGTTTPGAYPSGTVIEPITTLPNSSIPDSTIRPPVTLPTGSGRSYSSAAADDFPLRKGSKGDNVRALQQAIINKYGRKMLPKYGADGDFGSETTAALKKLKMPATISETFFNVLTQGSSTTAGGGGADLSSLAAKIYNATIRRDFNTVISLLKNIKSSEDYSSVSETFKQYRIAGVRKTLVTGLLDTFTTASQKQQLRLAFATMGLVYDGSKWSLSGLNGIPIVTVIPAKVWVDARTAVTVPARMILGHEIARRLQYVMFANNGRHFLVHANCIKQL